MFLKCNTEGRTKGHIYIYIYIYELLTKLKSKKKNLVTFLIIKVEYLLHIT